MHAGKALRRWRKAQGMSAARLARELPDQLADGQMIYRYEKADQWFGSDANGDWLVEQGAFTADCVASHPTPSTSGTDERPGKASGEAA